MLAVFATEDDGSDRDDTENNQEIIYTSSGYSMALVPVGQQYSTPLEAEPPPALLPPTQDGASGALVLHERQRRRKKRRGAVGPALVARLARGKIRRWAEGPPR